MKFRGFFTRYLALLVVGFELGTSVGYEIGFWYGRVIGIILGVLYALPIET